MIKYWFLPPRGTCQRWTLDILQQPHALIAGQTGSGKSVAINAIMHAALMDSPAKRQFILIDPKRVELIDFKDLPHVLRYATEPADMAQALDYAMEIIDARYMQMQQRREKLYYDGKQGSDIYIIIDELADLMTTQARRIEPVLTRIGQIGRAARVHYIAATQHILSSVITTPIKCNASAILALHTRTWRDSYSLIGRKGCETLPRFGQAYYISPEHDERITIQPIPQDEQKRVIDWWMDPKHTWQR